MSLFDQALALFSLTLAAVLGSLIGMERERRDEAAGLRTHMLVSMGACLFTILSHMAFSAGDPSRVAAQVVVGVGFLGAGVIYRDENKVHSLTTAAGIWMAAAIGMAVGMNAWLLAIGTTVIVWIVLAVLRKLPFRSQS